MSAHIASLRLYWTVFALLMVMTVLTVAVTFVDLGAANLYVALGIAIFKATIVVLYFMHARWSSRLTHVVILSGIVFLGILFSFTLADYFTRGYIGVAGK
ncbi:MAG: cytochrome C oxidase subunit IV family protein [Vicinamibacteraceae bacterium]|nr:cytochrome C oxidase subunit IV family protein [Vicinamibacteraceae bacterium]